MRHPVFVHHSKGGSGLCNFRAVDLPVYYAAVKRFNCETIRIERRPLEGESLGAEYSLHDLRRRKNLACFWSVFEQVKEEMACTQ